VPVDEDVEKAEGTGLEAAAIRREREEGETGATFDVNLTFPL